MLNFSVVILLELSPQRSSHILHNLRCISAPKSWSHIKNTVVLTILTFRHIQCLHFMYVEVAWVLPSSGTQAELQVIIDRDYLPDYLSFSYYYGFKRNLPCFVSLYLPRSCLVLMPYSKTNIV